MPKEDLEALLPHLPGELVRPRRCQTSALPLG
ncbi:hypothetical protein TNMX_02590 [Thermus sp. NMX2.A1]|nr:hypothetical protein TNMX_02590 [Thermus sp. NMX2.A1]